jgi:hypothetical protein
MTELLSLLPATTPASIAASHARAVAAGRLLDCDDEDLSEVDELLTHVISLLGRSAP